MEEKEPKVNIKLERHLWPDEVKEKKKKQRRITLTILLVVVSFIIGIVFNQAYLSNRPTIINPPGQTGNQHQIDETNAELKKFQTIYDLLSTKWYFGKEFENVDKSLIENAIKGMIQLNEDEHTEYLSAEELSSFQDGLNAEFVGIGVQYYHVDGYNIVERVLPNSPALRAGVMPGDIFYAVDGQSVIGTDQDTLSDIVRGEEDTIVIIDFKRGEAIVTLSIARGPVLSSAYGTIVHDEMVTGEAVGYLEINSFSLQTADEVKSYLDDMEDEGISKLIIDVRNNGGGYLSTVTDIASFFLPSSDIVIQEEMRDETVDTTYSKGNVYENFETIVMLVNQYSASASEVLAAALKENLEIEVIGVTSFGKGTVQVTYPFEDGSALKYTTAQWLTPKGNKIHDVGIDPTIEVKLHDVFYEDIPTFEEEASQSYRVDSTSPVISYVQYALDFLDYPIERTDGYFDNQTLQSLLRYQADLNMRTDGVINKSLISSLSSSINREWNLNKEVHDTQLNMAFEVLARPR